jgi:hypothetical protein
MFMPRIWVKGKVKWEHQSTSQQATINYGKAEPGIATYIENHDEIEDVINVGIEIPGSPCYGSIRQFFHPRRLDDYLSLDLGKQQSTRTTERY